MDTNNQNAAADEMATEFIGSLFAGEASARPTPEPTLAPAPTEKSADAEQIVTVPSSELEPFPSYPFQIRDDEEMTNLVESIKDYASEGKLTPEVIASIMHEQKPNQVGKIKIARDDIAKYFKKDDTPETITQTIIKALELPRKRERRCDDAR